MDPVAEVHRRNLISCRKYLNDKIAAISVSGYKNGKECTDQLNWSENFGVMMIDIDPFDKFDRIILQTRSSDQMCSTCTPLERLIDDVTRYQRFNCVVVYLYNTNNSHSCMSFDLRRPVMNIFIPQNCCRVLITLSYDNKLPPPHGVEGEGYDTVE
jgi:hypothetical protein